jgi:hypothetical protein
VITKYGGKCVECGESRIEFLQMDHVNGGGCKHRETLHRNIYRLIIDQGYPSDYQVLCADCNWKKYLNGEANSEAVLSIK